MSQTSERGRSIILVCLVTIITFGILLPRLGFYRDDWYLLSTAQSQGTPGIVALFQIDRPLLGYLYAITYRFLGVSPLAWQLAALALRLTGNLVFFWLLRLLWPERSGLTLAVCLLFSIYPGYTVQPNAGVYSTDLAASAGALLSLVLTLKAIRSKQPMIWLVLSILAGILELLYLGIFESAIGMEVVRFALVWYALWQRDHSALRITSLKAFRSDLLYLLLAAGFAFWRLFVFQSTRRATNLDVLLGRYGTLPVRSALSVLVETIKDVFETAFFAWGVPYYQFVASSNYRDLAAALITAVLVVVCILGATKGSFGTQFDREKRSRDHLHMLVLGALIVVVALLPINLAGRNVLFTDQWDRYTMYASSGVALLLGGSIFHYFRAATRRVLLTILIGMSVVVHYFSAASYRDFWSWQRDLWQQMVWRAPGLNNDTMLFIGLPVGGYQEGYEIYGPANIIYFPGQDIQLGGDVINPATAANIQLQKNREHYDRSVLVPDNYRNPLVAVYPGSESCLHVLDGRKIELPGLIADSLVADIAPYSRIELIVPSTDPSSLPTFLGGHTPRLWCHYYQRMDLARQRGDWAEVANLADEAISRDLTPEDVSEWMPALDAYATLGRIPDMRHAAAIVRSVDSARAFLCLQLQRGAAYPPPYDYNRVNQALCQAS